MQEHTCLAGWPASCRGCPEHVIPDLCQSLRKKFPPKRASPPGGTGGGPWGSYPLCLPRGWVTLGKPPPLL